MKNIYLFVYVTCIQCLSSCYNSTESRILLEMDSTTLKIKIVELNNKELLYSDVYTGVNYAILETNNESAIGNIEKLEVASNKDFIVFDRANGKILRFDSTGIFLNKIGMMGHSKDEYINPELMAYDEFNDNVIVYDGAKKSLLHYALNGTLVHTTSLHKYIADFGVVNGEEIAICANYRDIVEKGQVAYNLEIINREGNILKQYDPYSIEKEKYRPSPTNIFKLNDGKLLFHKYYTPVVYTLDGDSAGIYPSFFLDFMSKQIPSDWLDLSTAEEIDHLIFNKESDVMYCTEFYDTPRKYIVNATSSNGSLFFIYIDKNNSKQLSGNTMFNDIYGLVSSYISCYKQDKVYCVVNPEIVNNYFSAVSNTKEFDNYKKHLQDKGYNITKKDIFILEKMKDNQNPIVQICTLK